MIRKIFKTGHSAAITLSSGALKALGLRLGDEVKIETDETKGEVILRAGHKLNQLALDLRTKVKLGQKK